MNKVEAVCRVVYTLIAGLLVASCAGKQTEVTELAPMSTASLHASTITASATTTNLAAVSTATSTPVPSSSLNGSTLFEETFTDNHNDWYTEDTLVAVADGKYTHVLDCPGSNPSPQCGNFVKVPFAFPASFRMQIEATVTRSSDGAGVMVGIQVRKSDDGYYYLTYLITSGSYEMSRITQTGEFSILPETGTDLIKSVVGGSNVLGVEVDGAEFTPLVNDQELSTIHDGNIRAAGDGYLVVLVERGDSAELQLDNLVVERIQ